MKKMQTSKSNQPLTEKYKHSLHEIAGQEEAIKQLKNFISNYGESKGKKAALLYGPSGSGKTILPYALAKKLDYEIIELNASDFRNKEKINSIVGQAIKQKSLFGKEKIILIDEVDAISGSKDRGCMQALTKLLSESKFPVILTASDLWQRKLNSIRNKCDLIELEKLNYADIIKILERICKLEKIKLSKELLQKIAINARGDVRAAINDLQATRTGEREKTTSIFEALQKIFKTPKDQASTTLHAFDNVNLPLDECILWLDENLPLEYHDEDLAKAYEKISKADIFRHRIIRWQYWRFLVYVNALLTAGVAVSKKTTRKEFVKYKRLGRLLKIWWANRLLAKKKSIASKLAKATHCSTKKALKEIPFFLSAMKKNKEIVDELKLNREEIEYLNSF